MTENMLNVTVGKKVEACDHHNFGHYPLSCPLFKNAMFQSQDFVSVFGWNLLRWVVFLNKRQDDG
jgi:hypothetical protein